MADCTVPVGSVANISHKKRYDRIQSIFNSKFGHMPDFFARAPGRVNLIGEHIDYCGYAVHPMALEHDILIAVSTNTSTELVLANTSLEYKEVKYSINDFQINKSDPQWHNYFLCGMRGILEHFGLKTPQGMHCVVDGNIPKSAGLSSSSALVCCAALATMYANGHNIPKKELSDLCAHCEQYIGTEGGGMDQAISFLAEKGTAKLIEFNPLKTTSVILPDAAIFVISNSCVEMNKAATSHFNIRVVECRLAAQVIAKKTNLSWREYKRLKDVQSCLDQTLEDMLKCVDELLHKEPYSKEEICDLLNVTSDELAETSLSQNTLDVTSFKLFQRASHVFGEAKRVLQFKKTCDEAVPDALNKLGQLMNASHVSCRDMYECSCPELDKLVDICLQSGALGSRLTGAGWGGCAVSLVPANLVDSFISKIKSSYYIGEKAGKEMQALFATQPGAGAAIYTC